MGQLENGIWVDRPLITASTGGKFIRSTAAFRNWITTDGSAGPTGGDGFKAESGRYHLYVSHACPWANRTLIFRHLDIDERIDRIGRQGPKIHGLTPLGSARPRAAGGAR